ncbi:hypothetical protein GS436_19810 [Rhodococcus hoagii]|nr:hypothetical protein [Prescottella equi]
MSPDIGTCSRLARHRPLSPGSLTARSAWATPRFTPPSTVDPYKKPIPAHNRAGPHAA